VSEYDPPETRYHAAGRRLDVRLRLIVKRCLRLLQDQVTHLKEELDIRTEELREHRRLLARLIERVPELEAAESREEGAQAPAESTPPSALRQGRAPRALRTALSA